MLARQQVQAGHMVQVVMARQQQSPDIRDWLTPDLDWIELGGWGRRWHLHKQIKQFQPDVVHTHLGKASRLVGTMALPCPAVATLHVGYKPKDYAALAGLICVNPAQQAELTNYAGLAAVIPLMAPKLPDDKKDWRLAWHIPSDAFVIGAVGRFHKAKGQADLLEAFSQLTTPDAHLVLVGDGPERRALQANYGQDKRIHFCGAVPTDVSLYRAFDLFVSPSHTETYGLVLLEAMQAGCPIIATQTAGADYVLANQSATIVPVQDVTALHNAMAAHIQQGAGQRMAYDLTAFAPAQLCQRVVGFYECVIDKPRV